MEIVKSEKRSNKGRPAVYNVPMVRGSFRVPADTVVSLRKIGNGNITRAIIVLVAERDAKRITCPLYPDCETPSPDCQSPLNH